MSPSGCEITLMTKEYTDKIGNKLTIAAN